MFSCTYWKNYKAQEYLSSLGATMYKVVMYERDAIHAGIDPRTDWPFGNLDAGEQKEYGVMFVSNHGT